MKNFCEPIDILRVMWYACKNSVILNPFRVQSLTARGGTLFASKMPKFSSLTDYSDY